MKRGNRRNDRSLFKKVRQDKIKREERRDYSSKKVRMAS